MASPRILIVDDEPNIRFILEKTLQREGYQIESAGNGHEAIRKLERSEYELIILDLNMKPVSGLEVLNEIHKQGSESVVIILTAYSTINSAVEALRLGAFDYLFKPASPDSIRQRVREGIQYHQQTKYRNQLLHQIESLRHSLVDLDQATGSRGQTATSDRFLQNDNLLIDKLHRTITFDGKLLNLTTAEFDLLVTLVAASPEPVSPKQLAKDVLNYDLGDIEAQDLIKYHVHQLRQKIEPDMKHPNYIKTIRYKGYVWCSNKSRDFY